MKYLKEYVEYHNLNGDDDYDITRVIRDNNHKYVYCDGILYELPKNYDRDNIHVAYVSQIENTLENTFYQSQIEKYVEYLESGGGLESFPCQVSNLGGANNLKQMCEYLTESENFDTMYEILSEYSYLYDNLDDITYNPENHFDDETLLLDISNIEDLEEYYNKNIYLDEDGYEWSEEVFNGFKAILKYWSDEKEYTLTDMNHRFEAIKKLGKNMVYVDIS